MVDVRCGLLDFNLINNMKEITRDTIFAIIYTLAILGFFSVIFGTISSICSID